MSPESQTVLDLMRFKEMGHPRDREDIMRYYCRDALPDIIIELPLDAAPAEIRTAIYRAGAASQREISRSAFNGFVYTIRNGGYVAQIEDLIALADPVSESPSLPVSGAAVSKSSASPPSP